ncbi:MAG: hypothetical protein H7A23_10600 [Leptospiraceae bacterium]|nr:hypothetical protein [Leptospiraceae bacterium]MCP5494994.1 hypothetical protein [Leptospiraceae bacterium]
MNLYKDLEHVSFFLVKEGNIGIEIWKKPVDTELHQLAGETILQITKQNQLKKWIIDSCDLTFMNPKAQKYWNEKWLAEGINSGIRFIAFVRPSKAVSDITFAETRSLYSKKIKVAEFHTLALAIEWLKSIN